MSRSSGKWFRRRRGRVLAVKLGLNPNSSSLGVDVTFFLFGGAVISLMTPIIATILRLRRPRLGQAPSEDDDDSDRPGSPAE